MRRAATLLALLVALLTLTVGVAGCGGGEEVGAAAGDGRGHRPRRDDERGGEEPPTSSLEGDASAGEGVYASAGCGGCHTLEAAGSSGSIGPNLDDTKPDFALVVDRVTNGQGAMPSFEGQLTEQQIADVAQYVVESTG